MKFAIPTAEGKLAMHFGHCRSFSIVETDESGKITGKSEVVPPPHEPGVLPRWLGEEIKADMIIAGGMGVQAQRLFENYGVHVLVGAPAEDPEVIVESYLKGTLTAGQKACDH